MSAKQHKNVTKTYKKAPLKLQRSINLEAKHIATKIQLRDRIEKLPETPAYVKLKDHKDNFRSNPLCRLINPSKSETGKVSKILLDKISKNLFTQLKHNQWKNTNEVIHWFSNINEKQNCKFIQLDIKEFYPSISEETLNKSINFAENYSSISLENIRITKHCRKPLLFYNNDPCKKKEHDSSFDVIMGSNDGAELCDLIGIYIQSFWKAPWKRI